MNSVENIFQKEARNYDMIIKRIIPFYDEILETLVSCIPFPVEKKIKIIDLGSGTGTLALKLKKKYPNAAIKCLDIAEDMIKISKQKLNQYLEIQFQVEDLHNFDFNEKYDLIISSLALHHLRGDINKKKFFKKIINNLSSGGCFYNADVTLATNEFLEKFYLFKWINYMKDSYSIEEIYNNLIPKYYHREIPTQLVKQINWLLDLGFSNVDILWKYYHFVIYCGFKL
ncbi:MAG: class I SAM-dependent methyltransferase [Candidatus Lokiarchaeota archaeon]|nr:class I SAM-dependent methyltransferase [Candidatus Lokiarchaeota archaeon]